MSDLEMQQNLARQTGWIADSTDERDKVKPLHVPEDLPSSVDLRQWCSPIEDQGMMNACTAHAAVALMEYYQRRAFGKHLDASRLFLYKVTRNLLHYQEDKGANARSTMKALVAFGVPPEEYWPYDITKLYAEPPAFCYALASEYKAHEYYRIDAAGIERTVVLQQIKANLAAARPLMFGFILYPSCSKQALHTGRIPVPTEAEKTNAQFVGHTVAAVGYDDDIVIQNCDLIDTETKGAFLIRNSLGTRWGDSGYGWLPYEYVLQPLSNDWWTMLKGEWLDTGEFEPQHH